MPQDDESFLAITGVGAQKLKWFGPVFMNKIGEYCRARGFVQVKHESRPAVVRSSRAGAMTGLTYEETRKLVRQKKSLQEIMEARGFSMITVLAHIEKLLSDDPEMDIDHLKPAEPGFSRIKAAFAKTHDVTLSPVKAILGEAYSYDEIRLVRIFLSRERLVGETK